MVVQEAIKFFYCLCSESINSNNFKIPNKHIFSCSILTYFHKWKLFFNQAQVFTLLEFM